MSACHESLDECEQRILPTCDAHARDCQQELTEHVACVRTGDLDVEAPKFEFLSEAQYFDRYGESSAPSPAVIGCMHLLGMWPMEPTPTTPVAPASFYDFDRQTVIVTDPEDDRAITRSLAFALRDAELGTIATWLSGQEGTFDQQSAMLALFGGDGTFFGDAAWYKTKPMSDAGLRGYIEDNIYYGDQIRDFHYIAREPTIDYRYIQGYFSAFGAQYVRDRWVGGSDDALAEAFERPVRSTAELIRGRLTDTLPVELADPPALPAPYSWRFTDRFGAWMFYAFRQRADPLPEDAKDLEHVTRLDEVAALWKGDRIDCAHDDPTGSAVVVWQIALDTEVEPFILHTAGLPGEWRFRTYDDRWVLVGADDGLVAQQVADALE